MNPKDNRADSKPFIKKKKSYFEVGKMDVWHFTGIPALKLASHQPVDFSSYQSQKIDGTKWATKKEASCLTCVWMCCDFSLEAARRLWRKMEAINVICSPDMQGQPLVCRLHSLSELMREYHTQSRAVALQGSLVSWPFIPVTVCRELHLHIRASALPALA